MNISVLPVISFVISLFAFIYIIIRNSEKRTSGKVYRLRKSIEEKLDRSDRLIYNLEDRVDRIEKPPKFKVGDIVETEPFTGIIIHREWVTMDEFNLSSRWVYKVMSKKDPTIQRRYSEDKLKLKK